MSGRAVPLGDPGPWTSGAVTDRAWCVLAGNPGPMTLDGTNTWVLREPGSDTAVVVDPGPDDAEHLAAVVDAVDGARVARILLTHGHPDHSDGARSFADLFGAPVAALDPLYRLGDEGVVGGDVVVAGGLEIAVVATPGHTGDSLSFHLIADGALLTGDTVLGRGSTVVAYPDGRLGDYLDSLLRLRALAESTAASYVLPGHGPALVDPVDAVSSYLAHRQGRLDQVREAVARLGGFDSGFRRDETGGIVATGLEVLEGVDWWHQADRPEPDLADLVVESVYADVPRSVWPAARLSVLAQLAYLRDG
jgi:glyoxylase-like metal-dependent hydrolase (beta-lactamase superfamily II)